MELSLKKLQKNRTEERGDDPFWRIAPFSAVKWLSFSLLLILMFSFFTGKTESRAAFSDVRSAVLGAADLSVMQEADNQMIKRLYGIDPGEFEGVVLYYPLTNMGAEELFLVKMKDISQQEAVAAGISKRLTAQKNSFEGYGVSQTEMLNNSIVDIHGNYALFISAEAPAKVQAAFTQAL